MKNRSVTTVEITDSHIKVLHVMPVRGEPALVSCALKPLPPQADSDTARMVAALCAEAKIKIRELVVGIPRRFAIMRMLSLPSHAPDEIEKMVNLQVTKQVPYPKEDIVLDFRVIRKEASGYAMVLVVAVHKDVINRYLQIFKEAGLAVSTLTLSSDGLLYWQQQYLKKSRHKTGGPHLIINVDATSSEICFCQGDHVLFSRSVNFGSAELTREKIAPFIEQIELTVATYAKDRIGDDIARVILISPMPDINLLKEQLMARCHPGEGGAPAAGAMKIPYDTKRNLFLIDTADPLCVLAQKKGLDAPRRLGASGVSLAATAGLALAQPKKLTNLLPAEVRDTRRLHQSQRQWLRFGALFLCACALGAGVFGAALYRNTAYLRQLEKAADTAASKTRMIEEKIRRLNVIREKFAPAVSVSDIIYELYAVTPASVSFRTVRFVGSGTIELQGASEDAAGATVLQKNLVDSALFENVTLQYATKRKVFQGELTDFRITCHIAREAR